MTQPIHPKRAQRMAVFSVKAPALKARAAKTAELRKTPAYRKAMTILAKQLT